MNLENRWFSPARHFLTLSGENKPSFREQLRKPLGFAFAASLFLFSTMEVLLFEAPKAVQFSFTSLEYGLVIVLFFFRRPVGISLHLAFTVLSMGAWSYVTTAELPLTYWGLRLGGISFNIIVTIAFALTSIFGRDVLALYRASPVEIKATILFYLWGAGYGAVRVLGGLNYYDAWYADLTVYSPALFYVILLSQLGSLACFEITKMGFACAVFAMALSSAIGQSFDYGDGYKFALISALGYVGIIAVPFMYEQYGAKIYSGLIICVAFLVAEGALFVGGKTIVLGVIFFIWSAIRSSKAAILSLVLLTLFIVARFEIANFMFSTVLTGDLVEYKFSQIEDLFRVKSLQELAASPTSIGNLAAEAATISASYFDDPASLVFGRGFGGGISDVYGFLSPLARPGAGYTVLDAARDYYWRMHLPILEFALKGGIVGIGGYLFICISLLRRRNIFALAAFVVIALVVTNTKEMILCFLILALCSARPVAGDYKRWCSNLSKRR